MEQNLYISFSSDDLSNDFWIKEFFSYFDASLPKISNVPCTIFSNMGTTLPLQSEIHKLDLIIFAITGFNSEAFNEEIKFVEKYLSDNPDSGLTILGILKSPRFNSMVPLFLRQKNIFNFFEINPRTNEVLEFAPSSKGLGEKRFWTQITDLAYDIKFHLETKRLRSTDTSDSLKTVYLAEVSRDQAANREKLKREFLLHGFTVLPNVPLPHSAKDYQESARELIAQAAVSIHIMGELYGDSPANSDYSYQEIQNRAYNDLYGKDSAIQNMHSPFRFIWLPLDLEPYDEKQIQYLKRLRKELSVSKNSELVQCSIEEFKEMFMVKYHSLQKKEAETATEKQGNKNILIFTDSVNNTIIQKFQDLLKSNRLNYQVLDLSESKKNVSLQEFKTTVLKADDIFVFNTCDNLPWTQGIVGLILKNAAPKEIKPAIAVISERETHVQLNFTSFPIRFFGLGKDNLILQLEEFILQLA